MTAIPFVKLTALVCESNAIEGIYREPTDAELEATERFVTLPEMKVEDVQKLVSIYQPDAILRDRAGLDVRVGSYIAPRGGPQIRWNLATLLADINRDRRDAYKAHVLYEMLHPFTDGNGRSGRAIWMWQTGDVQLSFLRWWYYASLFASR